MRLGPRDVLLPVGSSAGRPFVEHSGGAEAKRQVNGEVTEREFRPEVRSAGKPANAHNMAAKVAKNSTGRLRAVKGSKSPHTLVEAARGV